MTIKANQNKKTAIQLILMIILTVFSQIVALYKSRFTAINFGATNYMDSYNVSLEIATFIFSFLIGGVTTVIIPAYVKKVSQIAIDTFISVTYGCVLLFTMGVIAFRKPFLALLLDRGTDFISITSDFLIISFIMQGIIAFLAVTSAYYQCEDRYNIPKLIVLVVNVIVLVILLSGLIDNIYLYFLLLIAGSVVNLLVDVITAIKLGFRYHLRFDIKNPEFQSMMIIFLPTLLSSGIYKLQSMLSTILATNLAEGQTTILSYSSQIITMVNTVIIGNLTVYIYPKIVSKLGSWDIKTYFWDYCILFHGILTLIIAGFITVGMEGMTLLFYGGKFTLDNVSMLYLCACIFISGQQFNIVRDLVYRYFYANGNTKETFKNSVIISVINVILSLILVKIWGIYGIVIGTVLSGFISLVMILIKFNRIFGFGVQFSYVLLEVSKNIIAMFGSVLAMQWLKSLLGLNHLLLSIFIYGLGTILIYVLLILLLKTRMRHIKL